MKATKLLYLSMALEFIATGCEKKPATLHEAAASGNINYVRRYLSNAADVNTKDTEGATPLHRASISGHTEIAALLIVNGADVNARDNLGRTPLYWAAMHKDKALVQLLIENHAGPNAADNNGRTPLHRAAFLGNTEVLVSRSGAFIDG